MSDHALGMGSSGTGNVTSLSTATEVSGSHSWKEISAGFNYSCGITTAGDVYCWGTGADGGGGAIMGDGTWDVQNTPVTKASGGPYRTIRTSYDVACAIGSNDNKTYCWGGWGGGGSSDRRGAGGADNGDDPPTEISGGHEWLSISGNGFHFCGVTLSNAGYCWGTDNNQKLGNGAGTTPQNTPDLVSGGHSWVYIAAGGNHSCGLRTDGEIMCWGGGPLGDGTGFPISPTPQLISRPAGINSWKFIAAGYDANCAISDNDDMYCWVSNESGNGSGTLGNGTTGGVPADYNTPQLVSGGYKWRFVEIGAGNDSANGAVCGITTADDLYCWGENGDGELGIGNTTNQSTPQSVTLP